MIHFTQSLLTNIQGENNMPSPRMKRLNKFHRINKRVGTPIPKPLRVKGLNPPPAPAPAPVEEPEVVEEELEAVEEEPEVVEKKTSRKSKKSKK